MLKNIFSREPIHINWYDLEEKTSWKTTKLVVLGSTPPELRAALDAASRVFNSDAAKVPAAMAKQLEEYFGATWRVKLGCAARVKKGGALESTNGGADASEIADSEMADGDAETEAEINTLDEPVAAVDQDVEILEEPNPVIVNLPLADEQNLEQALSTAPLSITIEDFLNVDKPVKESIITHKSKKLMFLYDMALFPEDKVSELKMKLNAKLGIPIFRQHVWTRIGHQSFPMKYDFLQASAPQEVDMQAVIAALSAGNKDAAKEAEVCGMPVDMFLYRNKDTIKIKAYDNFTLLGNLYDKSGTTEYHLIDLETFVAPQREALVAIARDDKYQLQMLYYGFVCKFFPMLNIAAFVEYLDERTIKNSYNQLEPSVDDLQYLHRQQDMMNSLYGLYEDTNRVERIDQILHKSLTETTLKVTSSFKNKTINLRLLFDLFTLTEGVDAIKLFDVYNGKHIILDKYLKTRSKSTEKLIPGVLYFRVIIAVKPFQRLNLFLYPNGAYAVKSTWAEDQNYEFNDVNLVVDKFVNPIIRTINSLADKVMYYANTKLAEVEKSNVKYIDISISLFWKKVLSTEEFRTLKTILDDMVAAKIIENKLVDKNTISYFFKKGMYEFDPERIEKTSTLDNYYAYLFNSDVRQKWFMLFENIRVLTITHRFSDVKLELSGVKEDEYYIFIRYIVMLMSMFMRSRQEAGTNGEHQVARVNVKPLNNLKEQDPHLYNFKKIYDSEIVYSKICQKPFQPNLLTQHQFDALDKTQKAQTIKYWNFTNSTDAYYQCPNKKYPHVRFIVDKHPMGYCIPCCKINMPPVRKDDRQRVIYDTCIRDHIYQKNDVERSTSRYIMSYGKSIDIGRLSMLPETSLEPLFYETKIDEPADIDPEAAVIESKYYLYGVPQSHQHAEKIGLLYCISHARSQNIDEMIREVIAKLDAHAANFQMLLGGKIGQWFATAAALSTALMDVFVRNKAHVSATPFTQWNELIMDVMLQYFNLATIIFEDNSTLIQLRLPDYIDNIQDLQYPDHQHLVVLHNLASGNWNPIYVIHKDLYFRAGIIGRKLYDFHSDVVQLVMEMIRCKSKEEIVSRHVTFDTIKHFVTTILKSKVKITKILVTRDNLCYGVILSGIGFVPVHLSHFKFSDTLDISFTAKDIVPANAAELHRFITRYNLWVAHESERTGFILVDVPLSRPLMERIEPIYPILKIERWLIYRDRAIGWTSHSLNFYIKPIALTAASAIARAPFERLGYDPLAINVELERRAAETADDRTRSLNYALYKNYSYQLLVLAFIQKFNTHRNVKVREALKTLIMRTNFKDAAAYAAAVTNVREIVMRGFDKNNTMLAADVEKLRHQIKDFVVDGSHVKKALLELIDLEYYNFDITFVERLKQMPRDQIRRQLQEFSKQIVDVGEIPRESDFVFSNILQTCSSNDKLSYCSKRGKLILSAKDLSRYLDVLSFQILNPFVEKYLFSPLFQDTLIDYFKFRYDPTVTVEIEFVPLGGA